MQLYLGNCFQIWQRQAHPYSIKALSIREDQQGSRALHSKTGKERYKCIANFYITMKAFVKFRQVHSRFNGYILMSIGQTTYRCKSTLYLCIFIEYSVAQVKTANRHVPWLLGGNDGEVNNMEKLFTGFTKVTHDRLGYYVSYKYLLRFYIGFTIFITFCIPFHSGKYFSYFLKSF